MKKIIISFVFAFTVVTVIGINLNLVNNAENILNAELTLSNAEGQASPIIEWWDRPDYDCVDVACLNIFSIYYSKEAVYVGDGKGSVAHTWNCAGC